RRYAPATSGGCGLWASRAAGDGKGRRPASRWTWARRGSRGGGGGAEGGGRRAPRRGEPVDVGEAGEPAVVDGVKGRWRVDPSLLGQPFSGRAALLSPFDRLGDAPKATGRVCGFVSH